MYEGYLQHDAQEVLQCILGHIQGTCQLLKEEVRQKSLEEPAIQLKKKLDANGTSFGEDDSVLQSQTIKNYENKTKQENAKRKNVMEGGNEKKKSKVFKEKNGVEENLRQTRSKRKALEEKVENQTEAIIKQSVENENTKPVHKKSRLRLNWLKSSNDQPSILSKFCSLGKLKTNLVSKDQVKDINNCEFTDSSLKYENDSKSNRECCDSSSMKTTAGERTECFSQG